ncbi:dockerin type I domain-containing protein [Planctomycetota bacterium]
MKSKVGLMGAVLILTGGAFFCGPAGAIEVLDPAYVVETYVVFDCANALSPTGMAFEPGGNLYLTHSKSEASGEGSVYRVDTDRNVSRWITGLSRPLDIVWGGGSDYGDYLYVIEGWGNTYWAHGGVRRISLDGTANKFSDSGLYYPSAGGVDRTGNYGGLMYVGNSAQDDIDKVFLSGQVQRFSAFPYNVSGSPNSIAFDLNGSYGGLMYVGLLTTAQTSMRGIYTLDTNGDPTLFAPDLKSANVLKFDTTEGKNFGGYLYAVGKTEADTKWEIYRVYPNGQIEKFFADLDTSLKMTFGPDGFLYVSESSSSTTTVTISRIMPKLLWAQLNIEEAISQKEEALEMVEQALVRERETFEILEEILSGVDPSDVQFVDLVQAKVKVQLSMLQERSTKLHLNKSIDRLKEAWMILTGQDEYQGPPEGVKQSELRRADINGDGVINAKDFAILSRYWLKKYER